MYPPINSWTTLQSADRHWKMTFFPSPSWIITSIIVTNFFSLFVFARQKILICMWGKSIQFHLWGYFFLCSFWQLPCQGKYRLMKVFLRTIHAIHSSSLLELKRKKGCQQVWLSLVSVVNRRTEESYVRDHTCIIMCLVSQLMFHALMVLNLQVLMWSPLWRDILMIRLKAIPKSSSFFSPWNRTTNRDTPWSGKDCNMI